MMHVVEELSKDERKRVRKVWRDQLIAAGGRIYVNKYNGTVVAIEPSIPGNNCKTFRVAIAYCNPSDKFKKSLGEAIAFFRLNRNMCNVIRCEKPGNNNDRMDEIANIFSTIG